MSGGGSDKGAGGRGASYGGNSGELHKNETVSFRDDDFSVGVDGVSFRGDDMLVGIIELSKGVDSVKLSCDDGVCNESLLIGSDSLNNGGLLLGSGLIGGVLFKGSGDSCKSLSAGLFKSNGGGNSLLQFLNDLELAGTKTLSVVGENKSLSDGIDSSGASPMLGGGADVGTGGGWSKSGDALVGKDCGSLLIEEVTFDEDTPDRLLRLGVRIPFLLGLSSVRCTSI